MEAVDLPAQRRASSGAPYPEGTAGCRTLETVSSVAVDLVKMADLHNLELASSGDLEVAAAHRGQGKALLVGHVSLEPDGFHCQDTA
jgi:hypothetical protein